VCGIAGGVVLQDGRPPPALEDLAAAVGTLRHRGPDECGAYRDARVGFGQARLSVIDPATGQQPLSDESGMLWVVFNGEIYNYIELRAYLSARGHRFRTKSDTEVIVHAYREWGEGAFERFDGQFAIALWDAAEQTLVLARDRLGICPLHLCEHGGRLWFASEVKAIFAADPSIPRGFDPAGLAETFTFWTTVAPQTVFAGITELEPGHVRTVSRVGMRDHAYWSSSYATDRDSTFSGSLDDAVDAVREGLYASVRTRMQRADVPVGCYLSGGLDSSLVAALGHEASAAPFHTFSVRFQDAEYDETRYQRMMTERIGSQHHEITIGPTDIAKAFPAVVLHAERPLLRTAPAPMFLLSKLVHQSGIKVVLTGEGADEMFGGYDLFREAQVRRFWGRRPASSMRPRLLERLYPYLGRSPVLERSMAREYFGRERERWREPGFGHAIRWRSTAALQRIFAADLRDQTRRLDPAGRLLSDLPADFSAWSFLDRDAYLETRTLLSGYLLSSQGDRMLMAHSVEGRFPYLDPLLVELASSLPARYKLRGLEEKHVLKRVASGLVPDEIIHRSKQPYRAPDVRSFVGDDTPEWVAELLSPRNLAETGVFDPLAVDRLWRKCQSTAAERQPSNTDNMALTAVLSTGLLHQQLIRRAPSPPTLTFQTIIERVPSGSTVDAPSRP
jgi:asparagine synthase (glutamine-hydrolysing)